MDAKDANVDVKDVKKREINWVYLTPLFLTALPLIRIVFRRQPVLRDRLFFSAIGVGLVHGTWLITRTPEDSSVVTMQDAAAGGQKSSEGRVAGAGSGSGDYLRSPPVLAKRPAAPAAAAVAPQADGAASAPLR
jgi:hypothetical protein